MKKLIGFAKYHGFDEKYTAFLAEKQQNRNDKKRGISQVLHSDDTGKEIVERAVSKITQYFTKNDASNDDDAPDASPKSNANAGATFGRQNATGGKRGPG